MIERGVTGRRGAGEWDHLLTKEWSAIKFRSNSFEDTIPIAPYTYKMIRSADLYSYLWEPVKYRKNIKCVETKVNRVIQHYNYIEIATSNASYYGEKIFNSIPNPQVYVEQKKYPVLQQHFLGWFITTDNDTFDDSCATFMDFTVPQNGNTRFMYILPINKKTALFEYTLFSKDTLSKNVYENAISNYLKTNGILNYKTVEKEYGVIPMTCYPFYKLNSNDILHIGTAGGWTKASTGYTFKNVIEKTKALVDFVKSDDDLSGFRNNTKFRFYDLIFLDVLSRNNAEGAQLFSSMFKNAEVQTIFKFLDEESTLLEDLKIILSVPPKRFIQAVFYRWFT